MREPLSCNTEYFQEYRKSWNLEVKAEEAGAGVLTPELLMQYCKAWAEHYQNPVYFRRIRKKQMRGCGERTQKAKKLPLLEDDQISPKRTRCFKKCLAEAGEK